MAVPYQDEECAGDEVTIVAHMDTVNRTVYSGVGSSSGSSVSISSSPSLSGGLYGSGGHSSSGSESYSKFCAFSRPISPP